MYNSVRVHVNSLVSPGCRLRRIAQSTLAAGNVALKAYICNANGSHDLHLLKNEGKQMRFGRIFMMLKFKIFHFIKRKHVENVWNIAHEVSITLKKEGKQMRFGRFGFLKI